jgi:N utilization substance protein B
VLLIGLAELKFRDDVPSKVAINEAVELAKRYGAAESYKFVNALLDKSSRELRSPAAAPGGGA